jgi:addiction module HigA family antidote
MRVVHPGWILRRELEARDISANALALAVGAPPSRITEILDGKRGISPETALRLARYFGMSAVVWLSLQTAYELAATEEALGPRIAVEVKPATV